MLVQLIHLQRQLIKGDWFSSNTLVATVSSSDVVTTVEAGTATYDSD